MKQVITIVTSLLAASLGTQASAQEPALKKVGLVRLDALHIQSERARALKSESDRESEPFLKEKAKLDAELDKLVSQWRAALTTEAPCPEQREQGRRVIIECRRRLEDLESKYRQVVCKKNEDRLAVFYMETNAAIHDYAVCHGYDLIMATGEPIDFLPVYRVLMRVMRLYPKAPRIVYIAPDVTLSSEMMRSLERHPDITAAVVEKLNSEYRRSRQGEE